MCGRGKGGLGLGKGSPEEEGATKFTAGMKPREQKKFTTKFNENFSDMFDLKDEHDEPPKQAWIDFLLFGLKSRSGEPCENYRDLFYRIGSLCAPDAMEIDLDSKEMEKTTAEVTAACSNGSARESARCVKYLDMLGLAHAIEEKYDMLAELSEYRTAGLPDADEELEKQLDELKRCYALSEKYILEYRALLLHAVEEPQPRASKRRRIA